MVVRVAPITVGHILVDDDFACEARAPRLGERERVAAFLAVILPECRVRDNPELIKINRLLNIRPATVFQTGAYAACSGGR